MSAVFYNKYRSLFFDDKDPEPISYQYFLTKPKNYLNIYPSNNIASLAQQYNILPKDFEAPRSKVEEVLSSKHYPARLDPLPYKPPSLQNFDLKPKLPSIEYNTPEPFNGIRELSNQNSMLLRDSQGNRNHSLPTTGNPQLIVKESKSNYSQPPLPPKRSPSAQKLPPIAFENTKNNIFPEKTDDYRPVNPLKEAQNRRKDSKNKLSERKQRLKDLLILDKVI